MLELGCGGGEDTVALADRGARVTGIKLSRSQLEHAVTLAEEHDATFDPVAGDVTALPLAADRFDLAYCTFVFQC